MNSAMQNEYLVDQILSWNCAECDSLHPNTNQFCVDIGRPCLHAKSLAACVRVCRRWSITAARLLWSRYATFQQVVSFISPEPYDGDASTDGNSNDTVSTTAANS
jgi:hypothetical protein